MRLVPALILVIVLAIGSQRSMAQAADGRLRVYFGTFAEGANAGIFVAELDLGSGVVSQPRLAAAADMPAFVAVAPDRKQLYAVSEVSVFEGKKSGGVVARTIDPSTGRLTLLDEQLSQGTHPCHIVVDKAGKNVLVANYYGGTAAVFPVDAEGRLKPASSVVENHGHGVNRERQEASHAHSINLDPANRFAFVCDLGTDKVFGYRFNPAAGTLSANGPPAVDLPPGSGPRHMAFHPSGRFAYVISELASTITAFWYEPETGVLSRAQTLSTLPAGFTGTNTCAEVAVHPNGKYVYGSNRGHDSIAIFSVDPVTGRLTAAGHEPTQGKTPRSFGIDPTGSYLLAANQDSNSVVVFRIDAATGKLTPTGQTLKVPQPCCVVFMAL